MQRRRGRLHLPPAWHHSEGFQMAQGRGSGFPLTSSGSCAAARRSTAGRRSLPAPPPKAQPTGGSHWPEQSRPARPPPCPCFFPGSPPGWRQPADRCTPHRKLPGTCFYPPGSMVYSTHTNTEGTRALLRRLIQEGKRGCGLATCSCDLPRTHRYECVEKPTPARPMANDTRESLSGNTRSVGAPHPIACLPISLPACRLPVCVPTHRLHGLCIQQ